MDDLLSENRNYNDPVSHEKNRKFFRSASIISFSTLILILIFAFDRFLNGYNVSILVKDSAIIAILSTVFYLLSKFKKAPMLIVIVMKLVAALGGVFLLIGLCYIISFILTKIVG